MEQETKGSKKIARKKSANVTYLLILGYELRSLLNKDPRAAQWGCTRITAASDKVYQLLAHGRWFSPGTPASSTTKTGRHDITEILLKVALSTKHQIKSSLRKTLLWMWNTEQQYKCCSFTWMCVELSVMLYSLSCSFTSISFFTNEGDEY